MNRRNFLRSLAATALVGLGLRLPKAAEPVLDADSGLRWVTEFDPRPPIAHGPVMFTAPESEPPMRAYANRRPEPPSEFDDWLNSLPEEQIRSIVGDPSRTIRIERPQC